jgi:hypothetical protein
MEDLALERVASWDRRWPRVRFDQDAYAAHDHLGTHGFLMKIYSVAAGCGCFSLAISCAEVAGARCEMLQCDFPLRVGFYPAQFLDVGVELDVLL